MRWTGSLRIPYRRSCLAVCAYKAHGLGDNLRLKWVGRSLGTISLCREHAHLPGPRGKVWALGGLRLGHRPSGHGEGEKCEGEEGMHVV